MPHANWKGFISFGLVNIPILLYSSEDNSHHVSFKQIDKNTGAKIKYRRVSSETDEEVAWDEIGKGYEYSKDVIIPVEDGELKKVAGDNARTIAIEEFVDKKNINFLNVFRAYYLVPDKKGEKGYVILREALAKVNKVGIAKIIISTKEYLAAVSTLEDALVVYLLRYDDEIKQLGEFPIPSADYKKYKVSTKEIDIAKKLIDSMSVKWKPEAYQDEYRLAVEKWVESKVKNLPATTMKSRSAGRVGKTANFIELLKKSLEGKKSSTKKTGAVSKKKKMPVVKKAKPSTRHARHH